MEKNSKKPKKITKTKSTATITLTGIIAALSALLVLCLRSTGIGMGTSFADENFNQEEIVIATSAPETIIEMTDNEEPSVTEQIIEKDNVRMIVISNKSVLVEEFETTDISEFKEYLLHTHTDGMEYIIEDDKALKIIYDDVKQFLNDYNYHYSETIK